MANRRPSEPNFKKINITHRTLLGTCYLIIHTEGLIQEENWE
jgi:hypothetical protein